MLYVERGRVFERRYRFGKNMLEVWGMGELDDKRYIVRLIRSVKVLV